MKKRRWGKAGWSLILLVATAACGTGANRAPTPGGDYRAPGSAGSTDQGDVTAPNSNAGEGGESGGATSAAGGAGGDLSDVVTIAGAPSNEPIDDACTGDRAFAVSGSAFVKPTEEALALALDEDAYGSSPITFVLKNGDQPRVAASYTVDASGQQAFAPDLAPAAAPGWIRKGGFGTDSAQVSGYLLVNAKDGPLEVPLENLTFTITTQQHCTRGTARLAGVIPASRRDLVDKLTAERGNGNANGNPPADPGRSADMETPVHAVFEVELVDFDFGSLP